MTDEHEAHAAYPARPRVETSIDLVALLEYAKLNLDAMWPGLASTDGRDYIRAATYTLDALVCIYRDCAGDEHEATLALGAWLDEDPWSMWLATDGDIRWYLDEYLDSEADAHEWREYVNAIHEANV